MVEDIDLVKKAKLGEEEALIKLIMDKKLEYYKLAYVYMKNEEDSLDAMQDMIVILYENISNLKKNELFYSWSKKILVNCCKKLLRKRKKDISLELIKEKMSKEVIEQKNNEIMLEEELLKLSKKHQEVIKLRYFLDMDYKSISEILKIPIGTVKSRIAIGIKNLKKSFGGEKFE